MLKIPPTGTFEEHLPLDYLRRTMLQAGLGFWQLRTDDDGRITIMVNDTFLKMLGCDEGDFPRAFDDYLQNIVHPEDAARAAEVAVDINEEKPTFEIKHRLWHRQAGEWRWFNAHGEVNRFSDAGRHQAVFGCLLDIHEETVAREKLQASEKALKMEHSRLDTIIAAADFITWDWDLAADTVRYEDSFSPPGSVSLGPSKSVADQWNYSLTPEDQKKVREAAERYLAGQTPMYEAEIRMRRPGDGRVIWAQDRGRAVEWDEEGRPTRLMGVALNISHHKEALEALAASRRELEQVVRTAGVATFDWDLQADHLVLNDIYSRMLGLEPGELNGPVQGWIDRLHPDDVGTHLNTVSELMSGLLEGTPTELRVRHQDGHYLWLYGVGRALERDEGGHMTRMAGIQLDFTGKKVLEEIQAHSLAVISSQKQALERQITERSRLLDDIQHQVERMINIPGSRLDLTQKSLREEMVRLQAELTSGQGESDGTFSRYMNLAFKFISNERVWYKAILDSLPFPTSVFDLTRHWTYLNPPAALVLDGPSPEIIGRHYREGWKNFRDSDVVFQEGQTGKKNFIRYLPENGRFFHCQSSMLLDETGRAIGFIETMQDITDAHEADERMRVMLDANPLACSFFGQDGSLIDCNLAAARLCGVESKREYVRRFYELMPLKQPDGRETREVVLEAIRLTFDAGHFEMPIRLRTVDGEDVPGEVRLTRVEWRDGYTVLGYCRDLRPLIAAQTELDRERLLLRDIFNGCPVPFAISQDNRIKFATPFARDSFGLKPGDDLADIVVDRSDLAAIRKDLKAGRPVNWRPLRVTRTNGSLNENLVNAYASTYEGRPSTMVWLVDVTQLRENERELEVARDLAEASTRAKSEFLANISHEIRTPMNAVIGLTHLLSQTELNERQREYVTKSDNAAKSLLHLINDILDFSKIESGQFNLVAKDFFLADALTRAVDLVIGQVGEKGLEFVVAVDPDAPDGLTGDDQRLLQVLGNLAGNAAKFTEQGEISLTVEVAAIDEDQVTLRFVVRDTGIGLDVEQADQLFSAFNQGDNSATRRYGGTGLGLAISKSLVELMGGEIWCESRPEGGSLFGFTARFGRHSRQFRYIEHRAEFAGLTALVVDDHPTARDILRNYLQTMGFTVLTAASGPVALEVVADLNSRKKQLDLLVVDWRMPEMDGLETARRIFELTAPVRTPAAVMATACYGEEITARAADLGLKAMLPKPLSPLALYQVLGTLLGDRGPQESPKPAKAAEAAELVAHLAGARILLVEDNEINQLVARKILTKAGFKVTVAGDGRQAVERTAAEDFDLVLMDIQMPIMDGLTATREIRRNPRLRELPIVAMTAHALAHDREKSREAGMNAHLCKPLDVAELFRCLARLLPATVG